MPSLRDTIRSRVIWTSGIMDMDGNPLIPDDDDLVLGQFEVAVAGVTLSDAVDLATPGPTPMEVSGYLDFQTNPYAVSLYRIQLDPGHFSHWAWR